MTDVVKVSIGLPLEVDVLSVILLSLDSAYPGARLGESDDGKNVIVLIDEEARRRRQESLDAGEESA